jgi:hypothetical protein
MPRRSFRACEHEGTVSRLVVTLSPETEKKTHAILLELGDLANRLRSSLNRLRHTEALWSGEGNWVSSSCSSPFSVFEEVILPSSPSLQLIAPLSFCRPQALRLVASKYRVTSTTAMPSSPRLATVSSEVEGSERPATSRATECASCCWRREESARREEAQLDDEETNESETAYRGCLLLLL